MSAFTQARMSKKTVEREQEMRRVAALGQQRTQRERAIKQKIATDREQRLKRDQQGAQVKEEQRQEQKQGAKDFRKSYRQREKEILEEKKRKEQFRLDMEAKQKARKEARKKEQMYMNDLHEQARIKRENEVRKLRAQEEHDRRVREAERKFRARIEQLEHEYTKATEDAFVETQARKVVIDNTLHQKRYSLEGWHRMRIAALESEFRTKSSAAGFGLSTAAAEQRRGELLNQHRTRLKAVEKEFSDRSAQLDLETHILKNNAENDLKTARMRAEETLRVQKRKAEVEHGRLLEDIARGIH